MGRRLVRKRGTVKVRRGQNRPAAKAARVTTRVEKSYKYEW
jgi:hypothetical protein